MCICAPRADSGRPGECGTPQAKAATYNETVVALFTSIVLTFSLTIIKGQFSQIIFTKVVVIQILIVQQILRLICAYSYH